MPQELEQIVETRMLPGDVLEVRYYCPACKRETNWIQPPPPNPIEYRDRPDMQHKSTHYCRESEPSADPCAESLIAQSAELLRRAMAKVKGEELQSGLQEKLDALPALGKLAAMETIREL